jgi:alkanesulfonate monooxygenase SsuD/methylene tetrahydromethanopterin reductase-like flavin-dependent oxidoreductase (luciferase family)
LQIIHTLLRQGTIDFQGKYYETRACDLRPRGSRRNGPPILIGAKPNRPRALRLTAQYADYWNIFSVNQVAKLAPTREAMDAACVRAGRDPATLKRTVTMLIDLPGSESDPDAGPVSRHRASRKPATGTPEELAELLRAFARGGATTSRSSWNRNPRSELTPLCPCSNYSIEGNRPTPRRRHIIGE